MRAINSWLDRFAMRHPRFGIPNLMKYIIIGNAAVYFLDRFSGGACSQWLGFWPGLVLRGQVWRLVTFVIVPEYNDLIWFALSLFFYYFLGTTLERAWGTAKFNLFYLSGALLTLAAGFIGGAFLGEIQYLFGMPLITMGSVNLSLFLAFATLYPDAQIRIYLILPVKAKWLALFYVAAALFGVIALGWGMLPMTLPPVAASLLNYLFFFWTDLTGVVKQLGYQAKRRTSRQTLNFKAAQKHAKEKKGYLHKCAVCGKTDAEYPQMEFRYCSKCNGYYCYCMDHINSHVHIQ